MNWSRREFLQVAATAPLGARLARWLPGGAERCLVVIELVGGNDGLNTVIPLGNDDYARARPSLGAAANGALRLTDEFGLHESMPGMRDLFADGDLAVVHGVGYANPDRSHFRSRDIWHAADPSLGRVGVDTSGWLGRAADVLHARAVDVPALGVGSLDVPLALQGEHVTAPMLRRLEDYTLLVADSGAGRRKSVEQLVDSAGDDSDLAAFVRGVAKTGVAQSGRLQQALARYRARAEYPDTAFGRAMQLTAQVLLSGFGSRLCHVPLAGFDTHARQAPTHAGLLRQLSQGVTALARDLRAHDALERTVIFVHSEFGRRVAENQSQGTDHGAAAPVFVVGGGVQAGLFGTPPNLTDLLDGDVRSTTDFRAVYAELLDSIGIARNAVLGDTAFESTGLRLGS